MQGLPALLTPAIESMLAKSDQLLSLCAYPKLMLMLSQCIIQWLCYTFQIKRLAVIDCVHHLTK